MPANNFNWAERIQKAKENKVSFEPVPLGRMNFVIKDLPQVTQPNSGGNEYIKFRAAVAEGPRANSLVFASTFPYAANPIFFLELMAAMGISEEWFLGQTPPTTEQIAQAMQGRSFSAEVFIEDDASTDKNGDQYRSLRKYLPAAASGAQEAPAAQAQPQQFGAPAQAAPAAPQAPAAPAGGNPWDALNTAPAYVPTPEANGFGNNTGAAPSNPFA